MKITLEQYPGFVQNLETLGSVDLSDNDLALLVRLLQLLEAARENVALAMAAQGLEPDAPRADMSRMALEMNTTIGYQDVIIDHLRSALGRIDRHVVGACDSPISDMPDPCEECGEMREIAAQALAAIPTIEPPF